MTTEPIPPDEFATQYVSVGEASEQEQATRARVIREIRESDASHSRYGSRIDEFEIVQLLGEGAFAQVFLARQTSMSRLVALKVSSSKGDEPQALAQFDHPNIVRVFDQRTVRSPNDQSPDDGGQQVHLLYMQFHPGGTLADIVKIVSASEKPNHSDFTGEIYLQAVDKNLLAAAQIVPTRSSTRSWLQTADWPKVVAWVGIQLSRALQTAHTAGVLHRDVKPANVLLTAEGIPQLADFNVSLAGVAVDKDSSQNMGGSIGYMSPEHLRAMNAATNGSPDEVRERADLYSLAVLLWELWQGERPFECTSEPASLAEMLDGELDSRCRPLRDPNWLSEGAGKTNVSARVLHGVLTSTLSVDPAQRPASGAAMAGQLRLALYPQAARLFQPEHHSIAARLMRVSPWWIATIAILLPNIAAGWFNYQYNQNEIMTDEMRAGLDQIAMWVNAIAFPFAVGLMILCTKASAEALRAAREGKAVTAQQLRSTLDLGHRAAIIGGACWTIAGVVYCILLRQRFSDFTSDQATHFFLSLLMCGGVAMIYPLFILGLIATRVYYPQMIRHTMVDPEFRSNARRMTDQSESYLLVAVLIPLFGLALMVFGESQSKGFMLTAIIAGIVGLFGSFKAYRSIVETWGRLGEVLADDEILADTE